MENAAKESKELKMKKLLRQIVNSLLNAFPFEDLSNAFPKFTGAQQKQFYELYTQLIASLHGGIQDGIDILWDVAQVGAIFATVEQFVEQQSLDPLFSQKTNIEHVKRDLLATKKNEIHLLQNMLDKAEAEKHSIKARIKLLRKTQEETSGTSNAVDKLRSMMANHTSISAREQDA